MNNNYKIKGLLLGFTLILCGATASAAIEDQAVIDGGINLEAMVAKHVVVSVTNIEVNPDGTVINGQVKRHRFGPRGPLDGTVALDVVSADGEVLQRVSGNISPKFVPKGIRTSTFSITIPKNYPLDAAFKLSFVE
ncbi:MAG: hypothetical protein KOO60_08680 [Gemmatimonadales bacterium]|nr:hypothetical protein [Gemmatimonadales bacterium]